MAGEFCHPKKHNHWFIQPYMSSEGRLLLISLLYPHIVIAPLEVHFSKYSFIAHRVY